MARVTNPDSHGSQFETILYSKAESKATITINRPEALNSLNLRSFCDISAALRDAAWDDRVAVVIITGTGDRAFCSGADLKEHWELCQRPRDYYKWISEFIALQTQLLRFGKPTIARLNGLVLGAGNEINLACDLAVASEDVVIRQAGPARGSVPAIGVTQWLPLIVGDRRAREAMLLCNDIDAQTALSWGLLNRVVPRSELDGAVETIARSLIDKFSESTRYTKTQTNVWKEFVWGITAAHAADWLSIHSGSTETIEGMQAFLEKRDVAHSEFRRRASVDESPEFFWGPPIRNCKACGARNVPTKFLYCGSCGRQFETDTDDK
jgi:enoyl-CoA hydratase/carnithine racemase